MGKCVCRSKCRRIVITAFHAGSVLCSRSNASGFSDLQSPLVQRGKGGLHLMILQYVHMCLFLSVVDGMVLKSCLCAHKYCCSVVLSCADSSSEQSIGE